MAVPLRKDKRRGYNDYVSSIYLFILVLLYTLALYRCERYSEIVYVL